MNCDYRVLLVDDYELWRQRIRSILELHPGLQVIGEASNGLEAVQKTQQLKPDLILLDIGLPKLNGIEVAREIRSISLECRIVFLTGNDSCDAAEAALNSGANGYVVKSECAGELIPAIEAVLAGRQYLSARLTALAMEPQAV